MKTLTLLSLTALLFTAAVAADEQTAIFDSKTLDGWVQYNGTATYSVEDGAIVGKTKPGSPNSFLCTKTHYADFELTFEVKVDNALNSGVQIRSNCQGGAPDGRVNGPQVEIEASGKNGAEAGYLFGEAAGGWMTPKADLKPHKHFKDGEWNSRSAQLLGTHVAELALKLAGNP